APRHGLHETGAGAAPRRRKIEAAGGAHRTANAITGTTRINELRIELEQFVWLDAELDAGVLAQVRDEYVGTSNELVQQRTAFLAVQIKRYGTFAAVAGFEEGIDGIVGDH